MGQVNWQVRAFDELTNIELYAILLLRSEVFVVEQQCIYQDVDGKDTKCLHVMGWDGNQLAAYTRLVPPGLSFNEAAIGRVVTAAFARERGIGRELMLQSIQFLYIYWGKQPIRIGAQLYLLKFYQSLGFVQTSDVYLEDGIDHIQMLLSVSQS